MNFYPFHIGDYISHTSHLTDAEDLAYRRMIDLYYQSEQPFDSAEKIARKVRSTPEIVQTLLGEYFEQDEQGLWHNGRADQEIAKYHAMQEGGRKGAALRWGKGSDSPPKQPPMQTKNQEPITKNHIKATGVPPADVSNDIFQDYLKIRKAKKSPWTPTAQKLMRSEAEKAGISLQDAMEMCCARGWIGFKAEWVSKDSVSQRSDDKQWMFSDQGIVAKANELGVHSMGLTYQQLKEKCLLVMAKKAMQ